MKTILLITALITSIVSASAVEAQTKTSKTKEVAQKVKTKKSVKTKILTLAKDSYFGFVGAKITGDHSGNFTEFEGTISVKGKAVKVLRIYVKTGSLVSTIGEMPAGIAVKLESHLKSPDFLNVVEFPHASFESTSIKRKKKGKSTHIITGNLEILGIRKSITFPATISFAGRVIAVAEFKIKRSVFGIVYNGKVDDLIKDDVLLKIRFKSK